MRSINRIGRKDTIKAYSYDKNRKLITSLYDSGFHSIEEIVNRLNEKGSGWLKAIYEVNIKMRIKIFLVGIRSKEVKLLNNSIKGDSVWIIVKNISL